MKTTQYLCPSCRRVAGRWLAPPWSPMFRCRCGAESRHTFGSFVGGWMFSAGLACFLACTPAAYALALMGLAPVKLDAGEEWWQAALTAPVFGMLAAAVAYFLGALPGACLAALRLGRPAHPY